MSIQDQDRHVRADAGGRTLQRFTALYEYDGTWWMGYVEELPGANTQG